MNLVVVPGLDRGVSASYKKPASNQVGAQYDYDYAIGPGPQSAQQNMAQPSISEVKQRSRSSSKSSGTMVLGSDGHQMPVKVIPSASSGDPVEMEYNRRMTDYLARKVTHTYSSKYHKFNGKI